MQIRDPIEIVNKFLIKACIMQPLENIDQLYYYYVDTYECVRRPYLLWGERG